MKRLSLPLVAAAGVAVLLLGGCSGLTGPAEQTAPTAQVELKALDRPATAEDTLPAMVKLPADVNVETTRLLVTHEGVQYFATESDDSTKACLAVVPVGGNDGWITGCNSGNNNGEIIMVSGHEGALPTKLVADGFDSGTLESNGWIKIAENILVSDL